jgi:hypothetical protein
MSDLEHARYEAIRVLCAAQAEDRLPVHAFEATLERIKSAPDRATLGAIVAGLQDTGAALAPLTAEPPDAIPADAAAVAPADCLRLSSVFASTKRAGPWTVPLELNTLVILGEMTLDLRDAMFLADVVDIDVHATLGSFTLIIPAGTQVENEIEETLTSSEYSRRGVKDAAPNGLLIRLRGRALLASIEIKEKYPTGAAPRGGGLWRKLLGGPAASDEEGLGLRA